ARHGAARGRCARKAPCALMPRLTLTCEAILFDLDGVLVDSRAVVERTWRRWAQRHGRDGGEILRKAHGRRTIDTVRDVAPDLDAEAELRWLEAAELNEKEGLVALPGAAAVLLAVPDARRAVVTSGGRALATLRMRVAGLTMPSVLVAAEDIENGKPAPDGYVLAASRLGVDPGDCVVIEDSPPGIAAGRAAGARVIAVPTTFAADRLSDAHVIVPSLQRIRVSSDARCLRVEV
ncbi:MAG: HAD-IA family hydrolase, partial [Gemmatimonadaceae bacterium]